MNHKRKKKKVTHEQGRKNSKKKKPKGETPVEVQHGGVKRYIAGEGESPVMIKQSEQQQ